MKITRRQLRRMILQEVRLLVESPQKDPAQEEAETHKWETGTEDMFPRVAGRVRGGDNSFSFFVRGWYFWWWAISLGFLCRFPP